MKRYYYLHKVWLLVCTLLFSPDLCQVIVIKVRKVEKMIDVDTKVAQKSLLLAACSAPLCSRASCKVGFLACLICKLLSTFLAWFPHCAFVAYSQITQSLLLPCVSFLFDISSLLGSEAAYELLEKQCMSCLGIFVEMQKTIFILNFGPDFFARHLDNFTSASGKVFFCHQKQYNFGASTLREKELTKEKMSYMRVLAC